jgi:protein gp37
MHCGLPRVGHLQDSPARVHFLSIETLLEDLGEFSLSGISWAIVAGESGPGARPMQREWVISVRDLCHKYHVPFFFKQWGGVRKSKNGRMLDDCTYDTPSESHRLVPTGQSARPSPKTF